jgi:hypothetical protein
MAAQQDLAKNYIAALPHALEKAHLVVWPESVGDVSSVVAKALGSSAVIVTSLPLQLLEALFRRCGQQRRNKPLALSTTLPDYDVLASLFTRYEAACWRISSNAASFSTGS